MPKGQDDKWKNVKYDKTGQWGVPIRNVIQVKKASGVISSYKIEGIGWVSKAQAVKLAKMGLIDNVVLVIRKNGTMYLRSYPDTKKSNNFFSIGIS